MKRTSTRIASTVALTVLATGTILGVSPAPVYAARTFDLICEHVGDGIHRKITAIAYYVDNTAGPGLRRWYEFRYLLNTPSADDKNNVNIRLRESGQLAYSYNSPDNRETSKWYILRPDRLVLTSVWGPNGEHDHRSNDMIEFDAIFDMSGTSDPHCTAWTLV